METPIHASNDVDRNENVPRIVAAVAGVALVVIAVLVASYSGLWSPPATHAAAQTTTATH